MASQPIVPQPGDVADEHGRFAPIGQPGDEAMAPETGGDPVDIHTVAIEDLADSDADANFPDPSRPIAMSAGAGHLRLLTAPGPRPSA